MKLLCVGYWKTGSKSCSSALRQLGYNVADYMETAEFLSFIWRDFIEGKATIEDVINAYDQHGFDTNQDIPGNVLWEDLYRALVKRDPNIKVIMTVRDNDAVWWKSWCGFWLQECQYGAIGDFCVLGVMTMLASAGYFGPQIEAMQRITEIICDAYFDASVATPGFSVTNSAARMTKNERKMRQGYLKHNLYVQSIVPKDNLLIWNLKEGWAPLCAFLDKPTPDGPIPHDNRTGDPKFMKEWAYESDFFKRCEKQCAINVGLLVVKVSVVGYIGYKEWKSGGAWLSKCVTFAGQSMNQLGARSLF